MSEDLKFLRRAFELGERGRLYAAPNPHVGCVIAAHGEVWGEGWHHRAGERHAEVHALQRVAARFKGRLGEATAYVTLEPCAHEGRTPPCADALLAAGIGRVVAALRDPSPWVAGMGMARLDAGGVVTDWAGEAEGWARLANRRFLKDGLWVVLKWAESADGWLAPEDAREQVRITSGWAQRLTHRWRAEEQGILVGWRTWVVDRPRLDVRAAPGRSPVRVVWAPRHEREAPEDVWWVTVPERVRGERDLAWEPESGVAGLVQLLRERVGLQSLLVEGGGQTLQAFVDADVWDECKWWVADAPLGQTGIASPTLPAVPAVWTETGRGAAERWHRIIRAGR